MISVLAPSTVKNESWTVPKTLGMTFDDLGGHTSFMKSLSALMLAFIENVMKIGSEVNVLERKKLRYRSFRASQFFL